MIVFGTCAHPASGEAGRRMREAAEWNAALPGVVCVNVQWPHGAVDLPGYHTLATLRRDARRVSGQPGPPKPVVSDVIDALARVAEGRGWHRIVFANSDVRMTRELVRRAAEPGDGLAVSRLDVTREGEPLGVVTAGVDALVLDVAWWSANRRRFRPYLMGEPVWDNVFAAILMTHGRARVLNDGAWLLHEQHPAQPWQASPNAELTRWLAALDRPYFSRWARYHHELTRLRAANAGAEAERAMEAEVFRAPLGRGSALVQQARVARAALRYLLRG
jgi:hypothetical protein